MRDEGNAAGYGEYGLATISKDGKVPVTRMQSASQTISFVRRLWDNDEKRSFKRSKVNGLVGGNPPYRPERLRAAGRAEACNVNWGSARMYMESGSGAFYDLATEAPGLVQVLTSHGESDEKKVEYSRIMSQELDKLLRDDKAWDFEEQVSQDQMTVHGRGPLIYEDGHRVLPIAVLDCDLKVPERTRAETKYWEVCSVDRDYYPPELYEFIQNPEAATAAGWDVEFTKKVISQAMDVRQPDGQMYSWEFYQQEIKNNSLSYYDDSRVCHLSHVFWKEFDGRITHAIVERESTGQHDARYLFFSLGRFASFEECVHPMYFDRGNGGFHHSVTGLGAKMFGGMEYENRLLCNQMDKAFAPKTLFRPTSAEVTQRMALTQMGDYAILPPGWEAQQNPIQGFLQDGLAMFHTSSELMRSNLGSYRQNAPMKQEGNPVTAKQVMYDASSQSSLSKTTYSRFYKQRDSLLGEIARRACNLNSTDKRALDYQERCKEKGVPIECFGRIAQVSAVRVIGQGSAFMRKAAVDGLAPFVGSLPEDGRNNWMDDKIACEAGQGAVERYNPKAKSKQLPSDQQYEALLGIGLMKQGIAPIVTSSQNAITFSAAYLNAGTQAMQSLQQGANPVEVLHFLELCGPAILAHLKRFAKDPLRHAVWKQIFEQWKKLAELTDQLKKHLAQQKEQQKQQQQKTEAAMNDNQIKTMKAKTDIGIKQAKAAAFLQERNARTKQDLQLADARAASDIRRNNMMAFRE